MRLITYFFKSVSPIFGSSEKLIFIFSQLQAVEKHFVLILASYTQVYGFDGIYGF